MTRRTRFPGNGGLQSVLTPHVRQRALSAQRGRRAVGAQSRARDRRVSRRGIRRSSSPATAATGRTSRFRFRFPGTSSRRPAPWSREFLSTTRFGFMTMERDGRRLVDARVRLRRQAADVVHGRRAPGDVHADRRLALTPRRAPHDDAAPSTQPCQIPRRCPPRPRRRRRRMSGLVRSLIRPYRVWVIIVFAAMMVETLDEPRRAVAAQGRARQRARPRQAAGVARVGARPRHRPRHDGPRAVRGARHDRHRGARLDRRLHRQLLHRERRASGSRTTCASASTTTSTACRSATTRRTRPGRCCRR